MLFTYRIYIDKNNKETGERIKLEEYRVLNENCRLDKYIAEKNSDLSRATIQKLIAEEKVLVNGKKTKSSYKVNFGDIVTIEKLTVKEDTYLKPQKMDLDVIFEDNDIIIVNKEKGIVVHLAMEIQMVHLQMQY